MVGGFAKRIAVALLMLLLAIPEANLAVAQESSGDRGGTPQAQDGEQGQASTQRGEVKRWSVAVAAFLTDFETRARWDDAWIVEVGQPWRNERAGLTEALLRPGRTMTVHGHRSANTGERLVKAERIVIEGRDYNLYPDRAS